MAHVSSRSSAAASQASDPRSVLNILGHWFQFRLWLRDCGTAGVVFWRENIPGMAGMIAFFGFLSIVPLTLLLLAVAGHLLGGMVSAHDVRTLFQRVMPGLSQQQFLQTYWDPIRHSRVGTTVLGVVSLVFGTLGLHDSLDWAVNRLWRTPGAHRFWVAKIRGVAVIVWVTVFAVLSLTLASASALVIGFTHALSVPGAIMALTPALLLDIAVFTALYTLTPTVKVRVRCVLPAATLGATLWGVSKIVFGWWVLQVGTYNKVYGPLAASVIVMLWLWISAMIFLYGAALGAVIQGRQTGIDGAISSNQPTAAPASAVAPRAQPRI